jgi:hypothetical protein
LIPLEDGIREMLDHSFPLPSSGNVLLFAVPVYFDRDSRQSLTCAPRTGNPHEMSPRSLLLWILECFRVEERIQVDGPAYPKWLWHQYLRSMLIPERGTYTLGGWQSKVIGNPTRYPAIPGSFFSRQAQLLSKRYHHQEHEQCAPHDSLGGEDRFATHRSLSFTGKHSIVLALSVACKCIYRVSHHLLTEAAEKRIRVPVKLTFPVLGVYVNDWRESLIERPLS